MLHAVIFVGGTACRARTTVVLLHGEQFTTAVVVVLGGDGAAGVGLRGKVEGSSRTLPKMLCQNWGIKLLVEGSKFLPKQ